MLSQLARMLVKRHKIFARMRVKKTQDFNSFAAKFRVMFAFVADLTLEFETAGVDFGLSICCAVFGSVRFVSCFNSPPHFSVGRSTAMLIFSTWLYKTLKIPLSKKKKTKKVF